MKLFISDGKCYRNHKYQKRRLSKADHIYLIKTTNWKDIIWTYFSEIEDDFRLLNSPYSPN